MAEDTAVILIGDNAWTDMEPELLAERTGSAYGFHKPWWKGVSLFHRNGTRYEVASATPVRSLPPLSKLLAATVYNPSLSARYEYRPAGAYSLDDLKKALNAAIDRDDDILTQFHSAATLKARVAGATSFDDIVRVLEYAAFEDEPAAGDDGEEDDA